MVWILIHLFQVLFVCLVKYRVYVVNHSFVLHFDVVLEGNAKVLLLQELHQFVVRDQLSQQVALLVCDLFILYCLLVKTIDARDLMHSRFDFRSKTLIPRIEHARRAAVLFHKSIANLLLFGPLDLLVFISLLS